MLQWTSLEEADALPFQPVLSRLRPEPRLNAFWEGPTGDLNMYSSLHHE